MTEPRFKYLVYDSVDWYDGATECDTLEEAEKEFKEKIEEYSLPWGTEHGQHIYDYAAIAKVIKILTYDDGLIVCEEEK